MTEDQPVTLAECVHCNSITVSPQGDHCKCGAELYPVTRKVAAGTRILGVTLEAVERNIAGASSKPTKYMDSLNGTPSEPIQYTDSQGRSWQKISQYTRHADHPDDGVYGHPNQYWVCPSCKFHVAVNSNSIITGGLALDSHDCFIEQFVKPVMLS